MKFWQLASIARAEPGLIAELARTRGDWEKYGVLSKDLPDLVDRQDRTSLDTPVDKEFSIAVLAAIEEVFFLSKDSWLRLRRMDTSDREITLVDSFLTYGGTVVENVFEHGSERVPLGG